jgi:hypothetical protein
MILICEDQESEGARACPQYAPDQAPGQGLSQRPDRCSMAGHRPVSAVWGARAAGQTAGLAAPPDHRGDLVPGPGRVRLAVSARGLPALADPLRVLRRVAGRRYLNPAARHAARPGQGGCRAQRRAHRRDHRFSVRPRGGHGAQDIAGLGQRQESQRPQRHIAVDAMGLVLAVVITAASVRTATAPGRCCGTCTAPAAASS